MGFDVNGLKPKSEKGKYFRNSVWQWKPLWQYVISVVPFTEEEITAGEFNNGHQYNKSKAELIGKTLTALLQSGAVAEHEKQREKYLKELPGEKCYLCKGTGKRDDEHFKGLCNACGGKGTKRPWECSYPFEEENVKEFAEFCLESGGFEIW